MAWSTLTWLERRGPWISHIPAALLPSLHLETRPSLTWASSPLTPSTLVPAATQKVSSILWVQASCKGSPPQLRPQLHPASPLPPPIHWPQDPWVCAPCPRPNLTWTTSTLHHRHLLLILPAQETSTRILPRSCQQPPPLLPAPLILASTSFSLIITTQLWALIKAFSFTLSFFILFSLDYSSIIVSILTSVLHSQISISSSILLFENYLNIYIYMLCHQPGFNSLSFFI